MAWTIFVTTLHLSEQDIAQIELLRGPLQNIEPKIVELAYPEVSVPSFSGSNNWAVTAQRSVSGALYWLLTPSAVYHSQHLLLCAFARGDWDAFGAAFPVCRTS